MYSKKEWEQWILSYLQELKAVYDNSPKRIKEDYGNESKVSSDYRGRAILEILQNADDAQVPEREKTDILGKPEVVFVLREGILYCANGGYFVSKDGLDSICRLSHSPKDVKDKKRVTIGEKGLGFKSVLSFSDTPEIHSGNLHCSFSRKKSYDFISKTKDFKEITDKINDRNVPLLRVPNHIASEKWVKDDTLTNLLKKYATVIKLPLSFNLKADEIDKELTQIDSTILLFLKNLEKLSIQLLDGSINSFSIERDKPEKVDKNTNKIHCSLYSNEKQGDWTVLQHFEDIPKDIISDLGEDWEEMDTYYVSFALQKNNNHYIPLSADIKNRIRVYFPTEEEFYIPVLFHATFFTDLSRKNINPRIEYNSFIVSEGVKTFLNYVMDPIYNENTEDPGFHLDFFATDIHPDKLIGDVEDDDIGRIFVRKLFQEAGKKEIIPRFDGELCSIDNIQIIGRQRQDWEDLYKLLGTEKCSSLLLIDLHCRKENRYRLIKYLEPKEVSDEELVIELNDVNDDFKDSEWCVKTYLYLHKLIEEQSWTNKNKFKDKFKNLNILKMSDDTLTSGEGDYKVFMPPGYENIFDPPDWLKIKFVHPEVINLLQTRTKENNREKIRTEYLDYFGVKQYRGREVVRECVTKDLDLYWKGQDTEVNPHELLLFLFKLQKDDLRPNERPEPQLERYLVRIPVPSKKPDGSKIWSKAGKTYASSDWTGNNVLEELYSFDEKSYFLRETDYFKEEQDKWDIFLRWLGVSWYPKLVKLSTSLVYGRISKPRVNQKLSYWNDYRTILESIDLEDDEGKIEDARIKLEGDYVLDRFFEICDDPVRQKILLNLLADKPGLIDNIPNARISYIPYKKVNERKSTLETNYQKWCLKNTKWLYCRGLTDKQKPSELCIPIGSLHNVLGGYARYVDYKTDTNPTEWVDMKSFLIRIGLSDNLDEFTLAHWYSIVMNISSINEKLNEDSAQKIRGIYRRLIRTTLRPEAEADNEFRTNFLENGKVLVSKGNEYYFVPPTKAYYVDKLDLLPKFKDFVPCFQVETKRSKRVSEIFGIKSLSEALVIDPDFGAIESGIFDSINNFFNESKPYLLARVRSQRADKIDSSRLSTIEIRPVRKIKVKYGLKNEDETDWFYDGDVDSLLFEDNESKVRRIYINARLIQNSIDSSDDFRNEDIIIQEISDRIAELLDIDLSEAFQLIMNRKDSGRINLLKKSGVTQEILDECKVEIKEPDEETPDEKMERPIESTSLVTQYHKDEPSSQQKEKEKKGKRRIWGTDDKDKFDFVAIKPSEHKEKKRKKGGGGGGGYAPYQSDPDIRKSTDNAGMEIVKKFEKSKNRYTKDVSTVQQRIKRGDSPGCDIHSFDEDGKLLRKIELKSSLGEYNKIEFTKNEWDKARNQFTGKIFYLYRVSKLDENKYPDGPELLIIKDPYEKGLDAIPSHYKIKIDPHMGKLIKIKPQNDKK